MSEFQSKSVPLQYARVVYKDLAEYENQSVTEFFAKSEFKYIEVYGLTMVNDTHVRVLFYVDQTDDTESEGIVIPRSCVVEVEYLVPDPTRLTDGPGDIN